MQLSQLIDNTPERSMVDAFQGYNHNIRINGAQFFWMENMTSGYYPCLSPRDQRGTYEYPSAGTHTPNGLISKDSLCYVDGTTFYMNNYPVEGLTLTNGKKQLISMGAYVIIMPDKKYINTQDLTDHGQIEASFESASAVTYTMCDIDGNEYDDATVSDTAPEDPANNDYWIDTSGSPHILKQYNDATAMWVQIATTYVKISCANIGMAFSQYDGVLISGIDSGAGQIYEYNNKTSVIYNAKHYGVGETGTDYIVVVGFIDELYTQSTKLTVTRSMPAMDFVIESGNRLWGCRYGLNSNNEVVNEIYASKLGDFKNWYCYMGIATDSYAASCGTDGQFTGAISFNGYPIFFKENVMHKVYGTFPANYQIQATPCRGVMKGAGESLAIVDEVLYYKSRNGVCRYDGSLPAEISSVFGNESFSGVDDTMSDKLRNGAKGGSINSKYYISMKSEKDGEWHLFVYDAAYGMWHREDNTRADAFCTCRGELYYIDHDTQKIRTVTGTGTKDTDNVRWCAVSGELGTSMPDKKYISSLQVRMRMDIGSRMRFMAEYDSSGEWEHLAYLRCTTTRSFTIPLRPHRCDHFRLRIDGDGPAKIYSIVQNIEQGSDA